MASACSFAPTKGVGITTLSLPSTGVLAGFIYGCPSCTIAELRVLDPSGAGVAGTFIELPESLRSQGWFAFRPNEPWLEGAQYEANIVAAAPKSGITQPEQLGWSGSITVLPAASAQPRVSARLGHFEWGIDPVPCLEVTSTAHLLESCGERPVLMARSVVAAELVVEVEDSTASQHAYRIAWTSDGEPVEPELDLRNRWRFSRMFPGIPSEVCFELFGTPLTADGVERSIARQCMHVDPDGLGTKEGPFERSRGGIARALATCTQPAPAYRALWCKTLSRSGPVCTPNPDISSSALESCERARDECGEDDVAPKPSSDDAADMDTSTASGGALLPENDDPEGGCSVTRSGGNAAPLVLLGLLSLATRRRRRARR